MLTLFSRKLRAPPMSVSFASVISTHSRKIPTACHFWGEHTGTDHRGHKLVIKHLWYCTPQCPVPGVSLGVTWESQQNMEDKVVRDNMQIHSALDGPPCSATAHNFKNSHQVPWCYLTQCKGDDHSWFGGKKKKCKSLSKTKVKRSICLIMMVEHPAELTVMFPVRNRQVPLKTFTSKHRSSYRIHQSYFNQDIISIRHCFSPGLWHYTVMANISRYEVWAKIQLWLKARRQR